MSDCNCKNSDTETIPDFTKDGFAGKQAQLQANLIDATHTASSLEQLLAEQGALALGISACVSATSEGRKVCFKFPVIGNLCINVPISIPPGVLKACGSTCGIIPKGLKVTLYVNDHAIWSGVVWGHC